MNAGQTIRKLRSENGWTQQQLADLLGVSKASVQKYEQGDVLNLKAETLRKMCECMNVSPCLFIFPEHAPAESANLSDLYNLKRIRKIMSLYGALNKIGRIRAAEYLRDLHALAKYRKEDDAP